MFTEATKKCSANARAKADLLSASFGRYFVLSMLAGFFIGIAVFMVHTIGAEFAAASHPMTRLIMGLTFPVGLTLIIFAGAELFTGNVMFVTIGFLRRAVNIKEALKILGVSYIGNLAGALFFSFLILQTGYLEGAAGGFLLDAATGKAEISADKIIASGILCNIMVCLALWAGTRAKEEVMKFIIILYCLTAFITSGYIHSVADMTQLALALLSPGGAALGLSGYVYVLLFATIGNFFGGVLIGGVYTYVGLEKE